MRAGGKQRICGACVAAWLAAAGCGEERPATYAGFVDAPVAAVAVQVGGRVAEIAVREGARVHAGQLLARLDATERTAAVRVAQAEVERAAAMLAEAESNVAVVEPGVEMAEADIERARAESRDAQLEFERTRSLVASGNATNAQLDAARARRQAAQAAVTGLEASRSASRGRVGATRAAVATAQAALRGSEAALALAQAQLALTEVRSPGEGLVVEQGLQVGEWAAPGTPVLTVEDLGRQWVRIDVEETAIGALRVGGAARIRVVAFPDKVYAGHVIEIGAEGEFALNRDVRRGRPDIRTFRVRVGLDRIAEELRAGMTAEVQLLRDRAP